MNEIAEIKEGAWMRTKDGRRVQIWRITAEDGCYCSDLQHHCASELHSTTDDPRAMTKPLSERINDFREAGLGSPALFNLLDECAALARRVEDSDWVACSDRLPGPCDHVEVFPNIHEPQTYNFYAHFKGGTNGVTAGNWYHNDEAGYDHIIHPTHWRPINRETPPSSEGGEDGSR